MTLNADFFPQYFQQIHGYPPFPWQTRLLEEVLTQTWPANISLPTASGKTAVMDIAVFALACQANRPPKDRTAPRRIIFIVDRRIVVDEAYRRAEKIKNALLNPENNIIKEVATELLALQGEIPLDTAMLRGGIYREERWARTPVQPVILCTTVDQVGSRILFRGYGLSSKVWPLHAGLLANDSLLVLDEAHCSTPFLQTLHWISRYRSSAEKPLQMPFAVTAMTATPRQEETPFRIGEADRKNPVLKKRLEARKKLILAELPKSTKEEDSMVPFCMDILSGTQNIGAMAVKGSTTLVVLNRVASARTLREKLRQEETNWPHEAILLTGQSRAVERDAILRKYTDRIFAGRNREQVKSEKPLIIVATQCVEVGADFDVDGMITEICPLDALQQRLGRLDRLGEAGDTTAICFLRPEQAGKKAKPDAVYGEALLNTWNWLKENCTGNTIEFGINALSSILPDSPEKMETLCTPSKNAPVIFPVYCDIWSQTGPEPAISPEPAVFLHGKTETSPDVRLVWRADLTPDNRLSWADTISFCPPAASETLPVPLWQVRKWLQGKSVTIGSDIESMDNVNEESNRNERNPGRLPLMPLRWAGPELSIPLSDPDEIRPGDVLIFPSTSGGCDMEGWNPASLFTSDVADMARGQAERPAVLRFHLSLLDQWGEKQQLVEPFAAMDTSGELPEDIAEQLENLIENLASSDEGEEKTVFRIARKLAKDKMRRIVPHPSGQGFVIYTRERLGKADFTDEDEQSALTRGGAVLLEDHLADVERMAEKCTSALPEELRDDIQLAARLHDLGKADPRFQALLSGGNRLRAVRLGLLAKSLDLSPNPAAMEMGRRKSGYPRGGRHEFLSVRLAESGKTLLDKAHDRDLVLHLIASHHGHCRPFASYVHDEKPIEVTLSSYGENLMALSSENLNHNRDVVSERFWRLVHKYGWWGLAYLEACLRLSDHRASETPTVRLRQSGREQHAGTH